MSTYVLGDIQGCFDELKRLLDIVDYDASEDRLWFVGDLVNRGAKNLETLDFIRSQEQAIVVLGNHDCTFSLLRQVVMILAQKIHSRTCWQVPAYQRLSTGCADNP